MTENIWELLHAALNVMDKQNKAWRALLPMIRCHAQQLLLRKRSSYFVYGAKIRRRKMLTKEKVTGSNRIKGNVFLFWNPTGNNADQA